MAKWLAAASVVVIALLVLLWYQIRSSADAAPVPVHHEETAQPAKPPSDLALAAQKVAAATAQPDKIDPASDTFFYKFDDLQPSMLSRNAAKCYTGGIHRVPRNAKLKLAFKDTITDGEVTVTDIKVVESTIDDPALVACFVREVQNTHWHDDQLPNWKQDDELVIRPERGMKKYTKENMDYVGDGPDFTKAHPNSATQ